MLAELYFKIIQTMPQSDSTLFGIQISDDYPYWLTADEKAFPALLLPAKDDDLRPDISLRSVEVLFSRSCVIDISGDSIHEGCYSLVRLKDDDPDIVRLLLRILEEQFCTLASPMLNAEMATRILEVATLFSRVDYKKLDLIGLWGELQLISSAANIDSAIRCWSTQKGAKYDFVSEEFVLDMKTTTKSVPQHRFSLNQLRPAGKYRAFIASLNVIEMQSGQTVGEIMDSLVAKVDDPKLRSAFLTQCLTKGGSDLYSSQLTLKTFPDNARPAVVRALDIPVPQVSEGDPIENIRFDVDLTRLSPMNNQDCASILNFDSLE